MALNGGSALALAGALAFGLAVSSAAQQQQTAPVAGTGSQTAADATQSSASTPPDTSSSTGPMVAPIQRIKPPAAKLDPRLTARPVTGRPVITKPAVAARTAVAATTIGKPKLATAARVQQKPAIKTAVKSALGANLTTTVPRKPAAKPVFAKPAPVTPNAAPVTAQ
jgi:hypothetical protein